MKTLRAFVAESVSPEDFYSRRWEGHIVEEIVRLLGGRTFYRIVMTRTLLGKAIRHATKYECDVFHLSCHGDESGICVADGTDMSWNDLADAFQRPNQSLSALILSSCLGGDAGVARAFRERPWRPQVIFGTEAKGENKLTFPGACISWPILYTELINRGITRGVFQEAVKKMNALTPHGFVYWRWDGKKYLRYPGRP